MKPFALAVLILVAFFVKGTETKAADHREAPALSLRDRAGPVTGLSTVSPTTATIGGK